MTSAFFRRGRAALSVAAATALITMTAFGGGAVRAVGFRGPYHSQPTWWQHFSVVVTDGHSSSCGPNALGERWECVDDYVPHKVEFTAWDESGGLTSIDVQLRVADYYSATVIGSYSTACPSYDCNNYRPYPNSYWRSWTGRLGGELQGRIVEHGVDAFGVPWTYDSGFSPLGVTIAPVLTAADIVNQGPRALPQPPLFRHRSAPEDVQTVALLLYDAEGHNVDETDFELYDPNGALATSFALPKSKSLPPNGLAVSGALVTPPFVMPHVNGVYTIRTRARDASGTPTAWGATYTTAFSYVWNTAPGTPQQLSPQDGDTVVAGAPIAFTVEASDDEGDLYTPRITVTGASGTYTATGVPAMPGQSVAVLTGLPPGTYTWTAAAVDSNGWVSGSSASRTLRVATTP